MKYNKNTFNEVLSSISDLDMGCDCVSDGRFKKDNEIWLSNEEAGDIQLKVDKLSVKVISGDRLTKSEKNLSWKYEDYETVDKLVDEICDFSNNYFSSFEFYRVVGGKVIK